MERDRRSGAAGFFKGITTAVSTGLAIYSAIKIVERIEG